MIKLNWEVGQKIWFTEGASYSFQVSCLHCDQTGKVLLASGKDMTCGVCQGRKTLLRHRDYKIRPRQGIITGFDYEVKKGNLPHLRWYADTQSTSLKDNEMYTSFYSARKAAQEANKKYGWPKKNFDRWANGSLSGYLEYPHRVYWGKRVRGNVKT